MYLLLRKYSRRHQADVQQVSIPIDPLTLRDDLEVSIRTEVVPEASPSTASEIFNANANLSPEIAKAIEDAGNPAAIRIGESAHEEGNGKGTTDRFEGHGLQGQSSRKDQQQEDSGGD